MKSLMVPQPNIAMVPDRRPEDPADGVRLHAGHS
jgi:hypothetical protein